MQRNAQAVSHLSSATQRAEPFLRPIHAAKSPLNAAGGVDGQRKGQHREYRSHPIRLLRRLARLSVWHKHHVPVSSGDHFANFGPTKREGTDGRQILEPQACGATAEAPPQAKNTESPGESGLAEGAAKKEEGIVIEGQASTMAVGS